MRIIDCHQHLWDPHRLPYKWTESEPQLNRRFSLEDYEQAAQGLGIVSTVFVECDADEGYGADEAAIVYGLAAREDSHIAGVVAAVRPERNDFHEQLDRIQHPLLKGVRRVLHVVPDDTIEEPGFIDNVRSLTARSLSFDLCVFERQLGIAEQLVTACSEVCFVLDHCGNPLIAKGEFESWSSQMQRLSKLENLTCKISGIVTNAGPGNWTISDLEPFVDYLVKIFGFDRLLFGSDWPVCLLNSSLRDWVNALRTILGKYGESNCEKVFSGNAIRVYRL